MAKYESLKDHVYEYITKKIQDGELLPKQKVNELEICKELEISRTPAREALIQLSSDNLIEYIPRKGFLVKEIDNKKKLDTYKIIGTLDSLAATLSFEFLTKEDFKKMQEVIEKMDISIKYQNYTDYCHLQSEFHEIYIGKCNNPSLIDLLHLLKNSFIRLSYMSDDKERLFETLTVVNKQHKSIADLFEQGNISALEDAIKSHWHTESQNEDMI
jgi:Transcriptional regulators